MGKIFSFISILNCLILLLSSCKSEDIFKDYTKTESYNSSAVIVDTTALAEIVYSAEDVKLIDYTPIITVGSKTSITLKAESDTEYRIEVQYSSGISKSNSLLPKTSDKNGYINWNWHVSANCKPGTYPVRIYKDSVLVFETRLTVK